MDVQDFRTLLDYHYWACDRLFDAIQPLTPGQFNRDIRSSFRSIRETVVHMYAAGGMYVDTLRELVSGPDSWLFEFPEGYGQRFCASWNP
jgi:uncharacterized damage-inducible protein DinB